MKSILIKQGAACAVLAAFGLWGGAANAASVPCPGVSPDTTFNLEITAGPGSVSCWDWGDDPNPEQNSAINPVATGDDGILQLPTAEYIKGPKSDDPGQTFFNYISGSGTGGTAGSFTTDGAPIMLLFKTGGGNNTPSWFAYLVSGASAASVYTWSITGTAPNNALSHITAYVPIPAAAWLLGSGLIGLFGIGRRRQAAVAA